MSAETSREKILRAAREVAREAGAGHLSLDAVAAKAGLSKGGLLYNFPSKAKLLQALVAHYLDEFDGELSEAEQALAEGPNPTARAFLLAYEREAERHTAPKAGILAAIVDDLSLLEPVRTYSRSLIGRMAEGGDPAASLIAYLAVEGLRSMALFETDMLTDMEKRMVMGRLEQMLA